MKSYYYLFLISLGAFFSVQANTPPPPSTGGEIEFSGETAIEYLITENLNYDQDIVFNADFMTNPNGFSLSFKGDTNNPYNTLAFDFSGTGPGFFSLTSQFENHLEFSWLGGVSLNGRTMNYPGRHPHAIYIWGGQKSTLVFSDIFGDVEFRNNETTSDSIPLIYMSGEYIQMAFSRIRGDVVFDNNKGNLCLTYISMLSENAVANVVFEDITGSIRFTNNNGAYPYASSCIYVENLAGFNSESYANIVFRNIESGVIFQNNSGSTGAAISIAAAYSNSRSSLIFETISGGLLFEGNSTRTAGGAIVCSNESDTLFAISNILTGGVAFSGNSTSGYGGAIYMATKTGTLDLTMGDVSGDVKFDYNEAGNFGGAVYFNSAKGIGTFSLKDISGEVTFTGNSSLKEGGALFLLGDTLNLVLSADGGNMTFSGNTHKEGEANAIYLESLDSSIDLRAREGYRLAFYDPVVMEGSLTGHAIEINKGESYEGTIVFSGQEWTDELDRTSVLRGEATIHNGTLLLEKGAIVGNWDQVDFSLIQVNINGGYLEMDDTALLRADTVTSQSAGGIRPYDGSRIIARTVDFSQGLTFDIMPFVENGSSGLTIDRFVTTFLLGGSLTLGDTATLYQKELWKEDQSFRIFRLDSGIRDIMGGDFEDAVSLSFNSSVVSSPYVHEGEWSLDWREDELFAVWTATGEGTPLVPDPEPGPQPVPDPEPVDLTADAALNSLWSTLSNVHTLRNLVMGQTGLRRMGLSRDANYWAAGIAEFSHHNGTRERAGYDYYGYGYSVGADTSLGDRALIGVAFGNIYGTNESKGIASKIRQTSYLGMLYSEWHTEVNQDQTIRLEGNISAGVTSNTQTTTLSSLAIGRGKWDNNVYDLFLQASWDINLSSALVVSPFIGIDYVEAREKAFTETGHIDRYYGKASLKNLSLPLGVSLTKIKDLPNGQKWLNTVSVSYIPDVYRKNPETNVRTNNGDTYLAQGVKAARNAGRLQWDTRYVFNNQWSLFASYQFEGRTHAAYHGTNLGVSLSF